METPRRRTQTREEDADLQPVQLSEDQDPETPAVEAQKPEGKPREAAKPNVDAPGRCVKAIEALTDHLAGARKTLLNGENCVVNRPVMEAQLAYLRENLPPALKTAAQIVEEETTLRAETRAWKAQTETETKARAEQTINEANTNAQNMMNQAEQEARALMERAHQEANNLMDRANQEAAACVEAARAEAARMVEDAEKKARQLIEEENIVRRARVESDEIREKAQQEAAQLQKNAMDFVDSQLVEADRSVSELLNAIRLERNEVRNRRQ
ncbi:MAG: hypothetical protein IKE24_05905 [Clostridia bacterium]|nr:hypothetical protein [Clostridia bacterium]